MRHRPPTTSAFVTPVWASTLPRTRPFHGFKSSTLRSQSTFSARRDPRLPLLMLSHNTNDEDTPTTTRQSPSYGATPSIPPSETTNQSSIPDDPPDIQHADKRLLIAGGALLALFTAGSVAAATGALTGDTLVSLAAWFETLGPSAIFLYAGIYFALELVAVPAVPLTLGSGYLFGLAKGTAAVSVASTMAATASFLIARYGLREMVSKYATRFPRFRAMDRAIGKQGFKFVFLLRLSPLLPFAISNYLYGLTSVNLPDYVLGSWLGMLPGTIAYVSAGAAVSALTDLGAGKGHVSPILILIGVAATIGALSLIGKVAAESVEAVEEEEVAQSN